MLGYSVVWCVEVLCHGMLLYVVVCCVLGVCCYWNVQLLLHFIKLCKHLKRKKCVSVVMHLLSICDDLFVDVCK